MPRLGTISPVVVEGDRHRAQLRPGGVKRIERGTVFYIDSNEAGASPALLHDRMTQTVLRSFDEATRLFQHVPPRPLQFVSDIGRANPRARASR